MQITCYLSHKSKTVNELFCICFYSFLVDITAISFLLLTVAIFILFRRQTLVLSVEAMAEKKKSISRS